MNAKDIQNWRDCDEDGGVSVSGVGDAMRASFEDWASRIVTGAESKSASQLEFEIVEALKKAWCASLAPELLSALLYVQRELAQIIPGACNEVVDAAIAKAEAR